MYWHAGEEGIFMSDLGRQLQFPTRTFHKPNYLQDFLQRLGLMYTKEQKGKAVVVCVRAPGPLLASYRQTNAPEGMWLQQGWLNAVHDAIEAGPPLLDPSTDLAAPSAPLLVATPAEPPLSPLWTAQTTASPQAPALPMQPSPAMAAVSAPVAERGLSHTQDTSQQSASSEGRENGSAKPAELKRHVRFELTDAQMPEIPEPSSTTADLEDEEEAAPALTEVRQHTCINTL